MSFRKEDDDKEYLENQRTIRLSDATIEALKKRKDDTGVPMSTLIRRAIDSSLFPSATSDATGAEPVRILGPIPAGSPRGIEEYENSELSCSLHPSGPEYAYVRVDGDSMDKIVPPGAYALVRKGWAMSGDTIAAVLTMPDGSVDVTLKMFRVGQNNETTLEPCSTNPKHKPIVMSRTKPKKTDAVWIKPECAEIAGVFTGDYVVVAEK